MLEGEESGAGDDVVAAERRMRVLMVVVDGKLSWLSRFAAVDLAQQMLLAFLEELVGELPPVRHDLSETLRSPNKSDSFSFSAKSSKTENENDRNKGFSKHT